MTPTQSTRSIDWGIADRLKNDRGFRKRFVKAWAQANIATQVRALRKKRRLNQKRLAKLVGTGQSAISRAEQADYDGWTFKTLVNLADGLDAPDIVLKLPDPNYACNYRSGMHTYS